MIYWFYFIPQKFSTFITVTLSLFVGLVILGKSSYFSIVPRVQAIRTWPQDKLPCTRLTPFIGIITNLVTKSQKLKLWEIQKRRKLHKLCIYVRHFTKRLLKKEIRKSYVISIKNLHNLSLTTETCNNLQISTKILNQQRKISFSIEDCESSLNAFEKAEIWKMRVKLVRLPIYRSWLWLNT